MQENNYSNIKSAIENGSFFKGPTAEILQLIHEEFHDELDRLKVAYSIPAPKTKKADTPSPSVVLYGAEYDEINRTLVGILAFRWIHNRDYASFIRNQPLKVRLTRQSFDWMVNLFENGLENSNDVYALVTSMIINDLGKSPAFVADYKHSTNVDISKLNHDMILYRVVKDQPSLIPSLARLRSNDKEDLLAGIQLGAQVNFGQIAQAENVPACLAGFQIIRGRSRGFLMRFMEQLLDISGAAGHVDHTTARKLIEPIFQSYRNVHDIALAIIDGSMGLREGYDLNITRKIKVLVKAGWKKGQELNISQPADRALMRLLCNANVTSLEEVDVVCDTFFEVLSDDVRKLLIHGLNVDGSKQQPAVQATYIPAMCSASLKNTKTGSKIEQKLALAAVFRYLARTLTVNVEQALRRLPHGVTVIERNVLDVLLHIVNSKSFQDNPGILDDAEIPEDGVAMMAEEVTSEDFLDQPISK